MPLFKKKCDSRPVNWKTNLVAIWISQLISLSAFYFCLPFLPLYLKEKNIVPVEDTAFWSGVFIAAAPVSMMIMAPIWGALGDRYGRKMMLVRATLSGAICVYLMSVVNSMEWMIVLRFLQGAFTGTVPSAQSLVAASTPDRHQGFALGLMMAAVGASNTAGNFFGGIYASYYGAGATFRFAGYLLVVSTILVMLLVREDFTPPKRGAANTRSARVRRRKAGIDQLRSGIPALVGVSLIALLQTYDGPYLPLYVEALYNAGADVATGDIASRVFRLTGDINAVASILAIGGSMSISYLMDKNAPRVTWAFLGLATTAGLGVVYCYESVLGLTLGRGIFLFFISGLASVLVVLMSRMTPPEKRGSAMGWTVTARSIGWFVAPLVGAHVANISGYVGAYFWLGVVSLLLVPLFLWLTWRYADAFGKKDDEPEDEPMEQVILPPQSLPITPQQTGASGRYPRQ